MHVCVCGGDVKECKSRKPTNPVQEHRQVTLFIIHLPPVEFTSTEGRTYIQEHLVLCGLLCSAVEKQSLPTEEKQAAKLRDIESSTPNNTSTELLVLFDTLQI